VTTSGPGSTEVRRSTVPALVAHHFHSICVKLFILGCPIVSDYFKWGIVFSRVFRTSKGKQMKTHTICLALAIVLFCPFASAQWVQQNSGTSLRLRGVSLTPLWHTLHGIFVSTRTHGTLASSGKHVTVERFYADCFFAGAGCIFVCFLEKLHQPMCPRYMTTEPFPPPAIGLMYF
jgi:hypothetical protein